MRKSLIIFVVLIIATFSAFTLMAAPPDAASSAEDEKTDIETLQRQMADSVIRSNEKLKAMAESLAMQGLDAKALSDSVMKHTKDLRALAESLALQYDSLNKLNLDIEDYKNLPSFNEIIIDNDGTIKVRTDSGLVIIPPDSFLTTGTSKTRNEITRFGENIIIDDGERVLSDIVLIGGDVTVNGSVEGDVLVIGGNIYVNDTGYIRGDATAVGGKVKKEEGAKVTGTTLSISMPFMFIPRGSVLQIMQGIMILVMAISLFFSALAISLFPRPTLRISKKLSGQPIKSFLFGYLSYIGVGLIWVLLLVSLIGIPLAIIGEPVAFMLIIIFSYAAFNLSLGEKLFSERTPLKAFFYGCLVTTAGPFVLLFLGFLTNSLALFVINMVFLGILIFLILPFGFGATLLARFGFPPRVKNEPETSGEAALSRSE